MARICDSCDKRFDPNKPAEIVGDIPRFGLSGAGYKIRFTVSFETMENKYPDVCPKCVLVSVKDSIEKWPPR